jgi:hypothetical protein
MSIYLYAILSWPEDSRNAETCSQFLTTRSINNCPYSLLCLTEKYKILMPNKTQRDGYAEN